MYKLVFADLDETLLADHHVPVVNLQAINKAKQQGVKVIPCTGRGYDMTIDVLKELDQYDQTGEYLVGYNGALIMETKGPKELMFNGLEYELMKQIFEYGKNLDVCLMVFTTEGCYLFNANEDEIQRKTRQKSNFKVMEGYDIDFLKDQRIAKINYENTDMAYMAKIKQEIEPLVGDKVTVTASSSRYIEFNKKGVNKGVGLKWLADYLDVPIEETIGIGDNYNDIDMIKTAGLGACVASAHQDIQDISDYVAKRDYADGSVAEVIEKFILKNSAE